MNVFYLKKREILLIITSYDIIFLFKKISFYNIEKKMQEFIILFGVKR